MAYDYTLLMRWLGSRVTKEMVLPLCESKSFIVISATLIDCDLAPIKVAGFPSNQKNKFRSSRKTTLFSLIDRKNLLFSSKSSSISNKCSRFPFVAAFRQIQKELIQIMSAVVSFVTV